MAEHYPKATVQAQAYCSPCGKMTPHSVYDGRLGSCLDCIKKREDEAAARKPKKAKPEQMEMF